MTCEFGMDDGAYILGALSPAERADFERHLTLCPPCRESVASLAVLPGLLGRLDAATVAAVVVPAASTPATLLPRTIAAAATRARTERRQRRRREIGFVAASLCLSVAVGYGVYIFDHVDSTRVSASPVAALTSMSPVAHVPVSAEVSLVPFEGGTWVNMHCRYESGYKGQWTVRLVVVARADGKAESIGTWTARAGQDVSMQAVTHLKPGEIERVELQRADGTPMLTWTPA